MLDNVRAASYMNRSDLGAQKTVEDRLSRAPPDSSDRKLDPALFDRPRVRWSLKVDLFASSWNKQLEQFLSWGQQAGAITMGALSIDWAGRDAYAFPPFCLVQKCLMKTMKGQAQLTLIAPYWPAQPWFPSLLEMASEPALVLPRNDLLLGPTG